MARAEARLQGYQLGDYNEDIETFVHLLSKYLRANSMPGTGINTGGAEICKTHVPTFGG